jgi:hypothetical protein
MEALTYRFDTNVRNAERHPGFILTFGSLVDHELLLSTMKGFVVPSTSYDTQFPVETRNTIRIPALKLSFSTALPGKWWGSTSQ